MGNFAYHNISHEFVLPPDAKEVEYLAQQKKIEEMVDLIISLIFGAIGWTGIIYWLFYA